MKRVLKELHQLLDNICNINKALSPVNTTKQSRQPNVQQIKRKAIFLKKKQSTVCYSWRGLELLPHAWVIRKIKIENLGSKNSSPGSYMVGLKLQPKRAPESAMQGMSSFYNSYRVALNTIKNQNYHYQRLHKQIAQNTHISNG